MGAAQPADSSLSVDELKTVEARHIIFTSGLARLEDWVIFSEPAKRNTTMTTANLPRGSHPSVFSSRSKIGAGGSGIGHLTSTDLLCSRIQRYNVGRTHGTSEILLAVMSQLDSLVKYLW